MHYSRKAYAKVNIGLRVLAKREDGFHPLKTYFHKVSIADCIEMDIVESDVLSVYIRGNGAYVGNGMDLMEKAARTFSCRSGRIFTLSIDIDKRIPFQAGMGGGSSDAASVLLALNEHFSSPLSKKEIQDAALSLGSDVPFFTSGLDAAYAEGRGEVLSPVEAFSYPIVIIKKKGEKVSTKEAFRLLDERKTINEDIGLWPLPLKKWKENYVNDFDNLQEIRKDSRVMEILATAPYNSTTGSGSAQLLVFGNEIERDSWINSFCDSLKGIDFIFGVLCCNS